MPHKARILVELIRRAAASTEKRIVVSVHGRKDISVAVEMLKQEMLETVVGLEGHADIFEFAKEWAVAFAEHRVLVTSTQSLLHLFSHGLLAMSQLSLLIFDDCTHANSNHPYCFIVKTFYLTARAKMLAESAASGDAELRELEGLLPRLVLFADWPLVREGENFLVKRNRLAKVFQYLRLFQCVVRPLASDLRAPEAHSWMAFDELVNLKDAGCYQQLRSVYLARGKHTLHDRLECVVQLLGEAEFSPAAQANALVLVSPEGLPQAERLLAQLLHGSGLQTLMMTAANVPQLALVKGTLLLAPAGRDGLQIVSYFLQQQTPATLAAVYLAEAALDPWLLLSLMAYASQMPICSVRPQGGTAVQDQAAEMVLWAAAIGASSPVDSAPFRRLRAFVGGYEAVAKFGYLLADSSPVHHWIRSTGAIINTSTSITTLLCICSYLPRVASIGTGLKIDTVAVKRVDAEGVEVDKDRHYYMTQIHLPPSLLPWLADEAQQVVQGPLTPSRFSSQTLAALEALKRLHACGVVDDNLIISTGLLKVFKDGFGTLDYNPFDTADDGVALAVDQIRELIPKALQRTDEWRTLEGTLCNLGAH